jgi:hypothetical protein
MFAVLAGLALAAQPAESAERDPSLCDFSSAWGDIDNRNPTIMIVRQDQDQFDDDDTVWVSFFNDDWSIAKGDKLGVIRVESDEGWFENEAVALEHGFVVPSSYKHVAYVFDDYPVWMTITRQKKTVDKLNPSGLSSDWSSFKSCRNKKVEVRDELARKKKLEKAIPKDPFSQLKVED